MYNVLVCDDDKAILDSLEIYLNLEAAQKAENLIQQDFTAEKTNEKWLTDITEFPCSNAKLYLAPVLDCYDGAIVGYHMDTNRQAELCCAAFENACK